MENMDKEPTAAKCSDAASGWAGWACHPEFGRNPAVVVDEGDDAGVEAALGGVVDSVHILGVGFVLFTDAPTSPTC